LHHFIRPFKIGCDKAKRCETEIVQGFNNASGILLIRFYIDINIPGVSGCAVECQGVRADDHILHFMSVETLEQLFVV